MKKLYVFLLLISLTISSKDFEPDPPPRQWKKYIPHALVITSGVLLTASILILQEARQLNEQQNADRTFINTLFNTRNLWHRLVDDRHGFVKEYTRRHQREAYAAYLIANPPKKK
ncbi:MAG TPA: hypothetical protein QGF02_01775 [Candidatus Babeliales bacterium]|nr:hypothetical protein [Candidatus Babeliales bacterium]